MVRGVGERTAGIDTTGAGDALGTVDAGSTCEVKGADLGSCVKNELSRDGIDVSRTPSGTGAARTGPSTVPAAPGSVSYAELPAYKNASPDERARISAFMASRPAADQAAMRQILQSPAWRDANPETRSAILCIAEKMPVDFGSAPGQTRALDTDRGARTGGMSPMENLADLATQTSGSPPRARLLDEADDGKTLAHHLAVLARTPPSAELLKAVAPHDQGLILAHLTSECADPTRINQGANTCGATVISYHAAVTKPGEYARLCVGLITTGSVMMANGDMLKRDEDSIVPSAQSGRSVSERLFQGALMEYGSPANYKITGNGEEDVQSGSVMDRLPGWLQFLAWVIFPVGIALKLIPLSSSGLTGWEYDKAAEAVFGADFAQRYSYCIFNKNNVSVQVLNSTDDQLDLLGRAFPPGSDGISDLHGKGVAISVQWGAGHFLYVEKVDWTSTPPSLVCRNHWDHNGKKGDEVGGIAPKGVTVEDPTVPTVRIPLDHVNAPTISGLYYPSVLELPAAPRQGTPVF